MLQEVIVQIIVSLSQLGNVNFVNYLGMALKAGRIDSISCVIIEIDRRNVAFISNIHTERL